MKCTAHRTDGEACNAWAIKGMAVCRVHGGSNPRAKAAAAKRLEEEKARRKAERELARIGQTIDVDPAQALLDLVHHQAGLVAFWRTRVEQIMDETPERLTKGLTRVEDHRIDDGTDVKRVVEVQMAVEYRAWQEAKDALARYAAAALRAGVEERRVRLAEEQGALVAQVIRRVLDRLDLQEWQRELASVAVPEELRALAGGV